MTVLCYSTRRTFIGRFNHEGLLMVTTGFPWNFSAKAVMQRTTEGRFVSRFRECRLNVEKRHNSRGCSSIVVNCSQMQSFVVNCSQMQSNVAESLVNLLRGKSHRSYAYDKMERRFPRPLMVSINSERAPPRPIRNLQSFVVICSQLWSIVVICSHLQSIVVNCSQLWSIVVNCSQKTWNTRRILTSLHVETPFPQKLKSQRPSVIRYLPLLR